MTSMVSLVGDVSCIVLEGTDARRFAQAQFSGNVDTLVPGHWQWNAWLTATGRVRALMHLIDPGDGTLVAVLRGGDAETEATCAAMARYRFRMQVTLTSRRLAGRVGAPVPEGTAGIEVDGTLVLGYGERSLRLAAGPATPDPDAQAAWRLADIRRGWPRLPTGAPEFLPQALGLEKLGAVALDKGCYPGQELVARLHFRGGHKYRLCHVRWDGQRSYGAVGNPAGATIARVLDSVTVAGRTEALVVMSTNATLNINELDNNIFVVSRFQA